MTGTVLITGAGRGIGFHVAHRMEAMGWSVFSAVHSFGHTLGPLPGTVIEMDITNPASVQSAAKRVAVLDLLINNAAFTGFPANTDILSVTDSVLLKSLQVNVIGSLRVCQAFVPALLRSSSGRIVNVTSIWGQLVGMVNRPVSPNPAYSISKAGLNMVTGLLASALKDKKISVNSVCPSGGTSIESAADEVVWAATDVEQEQTGLFFHCRKSIQW